MDSDIPIALRKGKRRNSDLDSPRKHQDTSTARPSSTTTTPVRRRKRVRFSDSALPSNTRPISTDITPYLRRASLSAATTRDATPSTPGRYRFTEDLQFTPFKQVLDDRVKRRIRRNGLSEEMNEYAAEKKSRDTLQKEIAAKDIELKRLRAELSEARAHPQPASTISCDASSQERVDEIEAELEVLRQSFALDQSDPVESWAHIPIGTKGPSSTGGDTINIFEDNDAPIAILPSGDADSLAMGLELQAARQAKQVLLGSFRDNNSPSTIHFADSPARRSSNIVGPSPRTPRTFYHDLSKQLKATTNRAEEVELALRSLENEIVSLGFSDDATSGTEAVAAILNHFRQARLELERTMPGESVIGFENAKILPELISKLKTLAAQLRAKEVDLKSSRDQQRNLTGNFEKAIIAAEKANARVKDLEASIDVSAEEMLNARIRSQHLEKDLAEKEKDVETLIASLNKYRSDVSRLESLIIQLESDHNSTLTTKDQTISDLTAHVASEQRGRRAAESSAISRLSKISELEAALTRAKDDAHAVEATIAKITSDLNATHSLQLGALNTRVSTLSTALAVANAEVTKLRSIKCALEERVRSEIDEGARAVESLQLNLIRTVAKTNEHKKHYIRSAKCRIANFELKSDDLLESDAAMAPLTPASMVTFAEFSEEISVDGHSDGEDGITLPPQLPQTPCHDDNSDDIMDEDDDHIPGKVELHRGRTPSRCRQSTLSILKPPHRPKGRRRYDSGIGMSPASDGSVGNEFGGEDEELDESMIEDEVVEGLRSDDVGGIENGVDLEAMA